MSKKYHRTTVRVMPYQQNFLSLLTEKKGINQSQLVRNYLDGLMEGQYASFVEDNHDEIFTNRANEDKEEL